VFIDSPGHARHHFCIYDAKSEGIFAGDTFGVSFREFDTDSGAFVFATTTPPQFDPDAWFATLDRLLSYNPRRMYVAHFGCVENVPKLADQLRDSIRTFAASDKLKNECSAILFGGYETTVVRYLVKPLRPCLPWMSISMPKAWMYG
jgi:glyoxylase-like metal-dependent hydrolase (beta-lactamase superfamily II)